MMSVCVSFVLTHLLIDICIKLIEEHGGQHRASLEMVRNETTNWEFDLETLVPILFGPKIQT
ncbi:hypothetical protein PM082_023632 [Marasmius tenuissimus]|nr:hypothetical protein PM082_023632 [Marasmius tenuissimus]